MKVLIWIVCFFMMSVVVTYLNGSGIFLGGIPTIILFGITFWIAKTLCKKYDEAKSLKNSDDANNSVCDSTEDNI
ncbi:MAG: hypothetical protein ACI4U6_07310 [Acutalibacteraceae bacterium]